VQRIIDYMEDALAELEEAAGLAASPKKAKAAPRSKSGARKAKPKAATGPRANTTAKAKTGQVNARKGKSVSGGAVRTANIGGQAATGPTR